MPVTSKTARDDCTEHSAENATDEGALSRHDIKCFLTPARPRARARAGALLQLGNAAMNVPYLSNSVAHWLGMTPADLFLYMFLPPLLLDSAVRTDYFIFKKVCTVGHT